MTMRRPKVGQQLREPITGRFDCGAYSGAAVGDADSRGTLVFTGRQVRLASDEPRPDKASPGLNIRQIDEALYKLSNGRINLDSHSIEPWASVETNVRAGKWALVAVIRGPIVDAGFSGGDRFRGAHGTVWGFDQDRGVFLFGDPLVDHWQDVPSEVMRRAAYLFRGGAGANVAYSRDVWDPGVPAPAPIRYSARFAAGASFFTYSVNANLKIVSRATRKFSGSTSAPCEAPRLVNWPSKGTNRRLAKITKGALAGLYVEPGASGVTVEAHR